MNTKSLFYKLFYGFALSAAALSATAAMAHSVHFNCKADGASHIMCEGSFSDGSDAAGMEVLALSYEDKVLLSSTLDAKSQIRFERPAKEFYVRLDGGEGHTVEIDHADIR